MKKMSEIWVAVKALIICNNRVLIIQRSNYANLGEGEWDIPGGGMQFGETLLECLHREVKEETGLTVSVDKLLYAMTALINPARQIVGLTYLCHANSDKVTLSHEHTDYLWATIEQLKSRLTPSALALYTEHSVFEALFTKRIVPIQRRTPCN